LFSNSYDNCGYLCSEVKCRILFENMQYKVGY